ncbi:hypothetical protein [Nocardioides sp.]|uniref:hypothetical protein n=1 Tax=Nocardioides sp. TaxID=35761 RepID=UPI0027165AB0|nr:hypothetical protein [Nocardioides sp.]MDO9458433.1 hypothetical protein [Nocardioides sp.]
MSELNPPDEPLDPAARARIRARVVAGTQTRSRAARAWLVPVAASIAVGALVVGVVLLGGDDERGAGPAGPATPSASSTAPDVAPTPTPDGFPMPPDGEPSPGVEPTPAATECDRETRAILPGAEPSASFDNELGTTTFYLADGQYTLCNDFGGGVTVHHPKPVAGGGERNPYELSSEFPRGKQALFIAGGLVPDGEEDFQVTYTFPDGHVAESELVGSVTDLWWLVVYAAPDLSTATDGPPTVEVVGGPPAEPLDITEICAQANHGC